MILSHYPGSLLFYECNEIKFHVLLAIFLHDMIFMPFAHFSIDSFTTSYQFRQPLSILRHSDGQSFMDTQIFFTLVFF